MSITRKNRRITNLSNIFDNLDKGGQYAVSMFEAEEFALHSIQRLMDELVESGLLVLVNREKFYKPSKIIVKTYKYND